MTRKREQKTKLKAQWAVPVSFTFHSVLRKFDTELSIGASYQIAVLLATRFMRLRYALRNRPTRNTNCLYFFLIEDRP